METQPRYLNNKCFFLPCASYALAGFLNSKLAWFWLTSVARVKRGGYFEAESQYVGAIPVPSKGLDEKLEILARSASEDQARLTELLSAVRHRLRDLDCDASLDSALEHWPSLTFASLQAMLARRFKIIITVGERDDWECWFNAQRDKAATLADRIADAEAEIDTRVYRLFDLTPNEIAAIEDALEVASPALSIGAYEAISAVEGLKLSDEGRERLVGSSGRRTRAA